MAIPVIEMREIAKHFGAVQANDAISFKVMPGAIHGIVGENGAGKSTAMKMLYGMYCPDAGKILVDGTERNWRSSQDAIRAGIGMVHQHFMLSGRDTGLDNVVLGAEPAVKHGRFFPSFLRPIDRKSARDRLCELARRYKLAVDIDAKVEDLPVGVQQRLEILKLLYRDARILILDEPTAVLTPQEASELFENLRHLRDDGKTIIIITHKLKEVLALTDSVTVFKGGRVAGEVETRATGERELARLMVGREVQLKISVPPPANLGEPVLRLQNCALRGAKKSSAITFEVRAGEVVGIAGVEGNGQSQLLQALIEPVAGIERGSIAMLNQDVTHWDTGRMRQLSVGFVPEDRIREGLLLDNSLGENFLLGQQRRGIYTHLGLVRKSALNGAAIESMRRYDVRPLNLNARAGELSGGNQQKLIIAREMAHNPKLLVIAQPTRGVDIGAIEFIHAKIMEARQRGAGVLLVSADLDEVMALSDRILVMYESRIVAEFRRGESDENQIGLFMGGGGG